MRRRLFSRASLLVVPLALCGATATQVAAACSNARSSCVASPRAETRYDALILEYAGRYRVEAALVKAVIRAESGFALHAVSPCGARGLMQLMPSVARSHGVADAEDPRQNIRAGVKHLRSLLRRFHDDPRLAIAAYNAGGRSITRSRGVPRYRDTQGYVARVLRYRGEYLEYGFGLSPAATDSAPRVERRPEGWKGDLPPVHNRCIDASARIDAWVAESVCEEILGLSDAFPFVPSCLRRPPLM